MITGAVVENSVDASAVGVYQVKFNITDSTGNKATEVIRTVNVKDLTAPVIALVGDAEVTHEGGADYTDAGATVTDNLDSDVEPLQQRRCPRRQLRCRLCCRFQAGLYRQD